MKSRRRGRPLKQAREKQTEKFLVMLQIPEKAAFGDAARLAGSSLSAWARQRLRSAAATELKAAGKPVAFLDNGVDKSELKRITNVLS